MSTGIVIAIVVIAAIIFGLIVVLTTSRSSEVRGAGALSRETRSRNTKANISDDAPSGREVEAQASARSAAVVKAAPVEVAPWVAPDEEALGVSRRMFFNRATVTLLTISVASFGASVVGFLWKGASGGFGSKINAGKIDDVIQLIRQNKGFLYLSEARAWVTEYPKDAIGKGKAIYSKQAPVFSGMQAGVVALYQKCPHLGCRVPNCLSSQWFECPCHGSQYNRVGEKKGGPAPRGMDRFGVAIVNGVLTIDTGAVFAGPAIGTNTTGQEAEGPHCIGAAGGKH
jgi:cytochrome b6-f complex iron-sulfur subunit